MSGLSKIFLCALMCFSTSAFCATAVISSASGTVRVNGREVLKSTAVFAGDRLETSPHSAFVLHGKGFSVQGGPETKSVFEDSSLLLEMGEIKAAGVIEIRSGLHSFTGDASESKFSLSRFGGATRISVTAGTVFVRIAKQQLVVRSGETQEFDDLEDSSPVAKPVHAKSMAAISAGAGGSISGMIASQLVNDRRDCISNCWSPGGKSAIRSER